MLKKIFSLTAAALLLFACTDDEWPAQPDWSQIPNPDEEVDDGLLKPAACTNNIVAHRGGATECKAPDNSLASLRYAIGQGCYGSECDIYWTKDDNVVVAHADGKCQINGMHPWEHTLAELRAGGGLSNGEQLPSLEDFLGEVMKESAAIAVTLVKELYPEKAELFAKNDLHIHVPAGAVPKEGPSACITLVTALSSLVSGKPVNPEIAMTGEVSLRGGIMPIGGLPEKLMAPR